MHTILKLYLRILLYLLYIYNLSDLSLVNSIISYIITIGRVLIASSVIINHLYIIIILYSNILDYIYYINA